MKFSEVVERVVNLSATINAYWDTELHKLHPRYPLIDDPDIPDPPPPPQAEEMRQLLRARPAEEVRKLMAIYRLGVGYFRPGEFPGPARPDGLPEPTTDGIIDELASGDLSEFLLVGVHELRATGIDLNALEPVAA